jgi:diguanylate cyclase (GGDEF)-like protein
VFIINFLALGMIWAYVLRSYPKLAAARFWTGSAAAAVAGAILAMLRQPFDSLLPLLLGGVIMVFAVCLAAMGVAQFFGRPVGWRHTLLTTVGTGAGLLLFTYGYDHMPMRMAIYSLGLVLPLAMILRLLWLSQRDGQLNPGARLAGGLVLLAIIICAIRPVSIWFGVNVSASQPGAMAPFAILGLMFLSMSVNFGFLLMAVDRLRNEVADLALIDDLTGVANRRHLMQRLTEECARSERSGKPFSLLVIDLDGFKAINDSRGHAAGDACLQHFTLMTQTRLRPGDMLARTGGDEFCVVLPDTTWREGAMIARHLLEECRTQLATSNGVEISIAASIGVAQWTRQIGSNPEQLMAAADQALYTAKKLGKDRYAVYEPAEPAPAIPPLRKIA